MVQFFVTMGIDWHAAQWLEWLRAQRHSQDQKPSDFPKNPITAQLFSAATRSSSLRAMNNSDFQRLLTTNDRLIGGAAVSLFCSSAAQSS